MSTTLTRTTDDTARRVTVARFDSHGGAQRLIDQLADAKFPVERIRIVGSGIRSIETVTGRRTKGRAALYGAGIGAWFGLFVALLFAMFTFGPVGWGLLLATVVFGGLFGAVAGFIGYWAGAAAGRRDFSSVRSVEADHYEVQVDASLYDEALRAVGQLAG
jgi:hypothetical protein